MYDHPTPASGTRTLREQLPETPKRPQPQALKTASLSTAAPAGERPCAQLQRRREYLVPLLLATECYLQLPAQGDAEPIGAAPAKQPRQQQDARTHAETPDKGNLP